jgi:hypothetical protein
LKFLAENQKSAEFEKARNSKKTPDQTSPAHYPRSRPQLAFVPTNYVATPFDGEAASLNFCRDK